MLEKRDCQNAENVQKILKLDTKFSFEGDCQIQKLMESKMEAEKIMDKNEDSQIFSLKKKL